MSALFQPMGTPDEKQKAKQTEEEKKELQPIEVLTAIEGHLKSIRSMLTFFTVLLILGIIVQGCSVLAGL